MKKQGSKKYTWTIPFFVVFALVTALAWLLPLRPDYSEDEKRKLAAFPEFSARSLFDGSYFDGIDAWFSDSFTGRELWLDLSETLQGLYGAGEIEIFGGLSHSDEIPDAPATPPAEEPDPWELVDKYSWNGNVVTDEDFISFGTVLQIDDACYEYFYFYQAGADKFARLMSRAADIAGERARVYSVIAPTAIGIMFSQEYLDEIGTASQSDTLDYLYGSMQGVTGVDSFGALRYRNGDYLYFRTDHHWTARAAYYVYREYCKTAGLEPADLNDFEEKVFDGFLGSLYSYARRSSLLTPDTVYAYVPPGDITTTITTLSGSTYNIDIICDM
ncbi:MAG: DHHW family protein, partial [Oscillospiraceae bacterium]|nr:DHHW family protein [Oscillospiraceae bacterium]